MRFEDIEHFPDKTFRRPVGQRQLPAGFGHALQFSGGDFRSRCEHHAEHAHDQIELFVIERQRLGVSFLEINVQFRFGSASARLSDEIAGDINAANRAAISRCDDGKISRAASHVEHSRSAQERLMCHEFLGDIFNAAGDLPEVAGFPRRLLLRFDGFEIGNGRAVEMTFRCDGVGVRR